MSGCCQFSFQGCGQFKALPGIHFLTQEAIKMNSDFARTSWVPLDQKFHITVLTLGSVDPGKLYVARSTTIWPLIASILVRGMLMSGHTPAGSKREERKRREEKRRSQQVPGN